MTDTSPLFTARLAERQVGREGLEARYDPDRSVSQVRVDGVWIDAVDCNSIEAGTLVTEVRQETHDNE